MSGTAKYRKYKVGSHSCAGSELYCPSYRVCCSRYLQARWQIYMAANLSFFGVLQAFSCHISGLALCVSGYSWDIESGIKLKNHRLVLRHFLSRLGAGVTLVPLYWWWHPSPSSLIDKYYRRRHSSAPQVCPLCLQQLIEHQILIFSSGTGPLQFT